MVIQSNWRTGDGSFIYPMARVEYRQATAYPIPSDRQVLLPQMMSKNGAKFAPKDAVVFFSGIQC